MAETPLPVVHMTVMMEEVTATGEPVEGATPAPERYGVSIVPVGTEVQEEGQAKTLRVTLSAVWDEVDDSSHLAFTAPRAGFWALTTRNDEGEVTARSGPAFSQQDELVLFPREG